MGGHSGAADASELSALSAQLAERDTEVSDLQDMLKQEIQIGLRAQSEMQQLRQQLQEATAKLQASVDVGGASSASGTSSAPAKSAARRKVRATKSNTARRKRVTASSDKLKTNGGTANAPLTGRNALEANKGVASTETDEVSRLRVALAQSEQQLLGAKQARKVAMQRAAATETNRNGEREMLVRAAAELTSLRAEAAEASAENERLARLLTKRNLELATMRDHLEVEARDHEVAEALWHDKHSSVIDRLEQLQAKTASTVHRRAASALLGSRATALTTMTVFVCWSAHCLSAPGQLAKAERHAAGRTIKVVGRCLACWRIVAMASQFRAQRGELEGIRTVLEADETQARAVAAAEAVRQRQQHDTNFEQDDAMSLVDAPAVSDSKGHGRPSSEPNKDEVVATADKAVMPEEFAAEVTRQAVDDFKRPTSYAAFDQSSFVQADDPETADKKKLSSNETVSEPPHMPVVRHARVVSKSKARGCCAATPTKQ
eukprot:SAG31_NODE_38_length_31498_cov_41.930539_6_plen_491_part_00